MSIKRIRIFAGPNGSGKTTIIRNFPQNINLGIYINADDIENTINTLKILDFNQYSITATQEELLYFLHHEGFSLHKSINSQISENFELENNIMKLNLAIDSYFAADIAEFIRNKLLELGVSFTFETVMSHTSKLNLIKKAKSLGYRVYLYYIATENPMINISRVNLRVAQKGHYVDTNTISNRYYKSLENLKSALLMTDRAYIWDNSKEIALLFAEVTNGTLVNILENKNIPNWFLNYVVNKTNN